MVKSAENLEEIVFAFDEAKNKVLRKERGVGFEAMIALIYAGKLVDVLPHPNQTRYPDQNIYVIDVNGYIYMMPFVREGKKRFLKTIFPSRKATRQYIKD